MKRQNKIKKGLTFIVATFALTTLMSISVFAYSLISYGYVSKSIPIESRTSYSSEFNAARWAWNNSVSGVSIYTVAGSGHSWITDDMTTETWNGQYEAVSRQYGFWGRATKFHITINRSICVNHGSNFKQSVICHELGHALSLDDQPNSSDCIMGYARDRDSMITPQQDDINGVNAAY